MTISVTWLDDNKTITQTGKTQTEINRMITLFSELQGQGDVLIRVTKE
jgi:hypothetical protein